MADKKDLENKQKMVYSFTGDQILAQGLRIRRRSVALALANLLSLFLLKFNSPYLDIPVAVFVTCSYIYSRGFRRWEVKNAQYLRERGFEVKGV